MAREQVLERRITPTPAAVGLARDIVDMMLKNCGLERYRTLRDNAALVVSELMENALQVTPAVTGLIRLTVVLDPTGLNLSVWDQSFEKPVPDRTELTLEAIDSAPNEEFGGWGLLIVEQLAAASGYRPTWPTGKWVWARLKVVDE